MADLFESGQERVLDGIACVLFVGEDASRDHQQAAKVGADTCREGVLVTGLQPGQQSRLVLDRGGFRLERRLAHDRGA